MVANAEAPGDGAGRQVAPVAVIVALALERRSVERAVPQGLPMAIEIVQSGPGPVSAARAATKALDSGAKALLSFGLAAGLVQRCKPGSIVVPQSIQSIDGQVLSTGTSWQRALVESLRPDFEVSTGSLVGVDQVLCTPAAKKRVADEFNVVAADMESAAVAAVAIERGVPAAALRVVADGVDDTLPGDIENWVHSDGRARLSLKSLLLHPTTLSGLLLLGRRSRLAQQVMRQVVTRLLATRTLWPTLAISSETKGTSS